MEFKTQTLRLFANGSDEDQEIGGIYDHFMKIIDAMSGIDHALENWYTPLIYSRKREEYCSVKNKEMVIGESFKSTKKYKKNYQGIGRASFHALSQEFGIGKDTDDARYLSKITFTSGSSRRPDSIIIEIRETHQGYPENYWKNVVEILRRLSILEKPTWTNVSTAHYQDYTAFPHREWVGWMTMIPDIDLTKDLDFIPYSEYIPDIGTLIVTTKEPFSEKNAEHVELGRAVEVFLADRGLLPEL